uniref:C2H2-type domain-containing protein n=1 Tax=Moschus moschiferus TaxID=68415 RepID=A0A8C6CYJ3_MOSMO
MTQHVAEFLVPRNLELPALVTKVVSSLTITDPFVAASESATLPPRHPPAAPRRFICSFPNCSTNYNKAWKLDAHLRKYTVGCGKALVKDYNLSCHALIHTQEKSFVQLATQKQYNTRCSIFLIFPVSECLLLGCPELLSLLLL